VARAVYPIPVALRLMALHREFNSFMRFRITEPVFFLGQDRKVDEIMEAPVGPYRNFPTGGGLQRIPQFVEMPEEITQVSKEATAPAASSQQPAVAQQAAPASPGTTAPPAPTPLPSVSPVKVAPKANPLASRIRALATRRAKFQDAAAAILADAEHDMTVVETTGPAVLKRAAAASNDELTAITDLGSSLKELDATNGGPLAD